jgi:hypothetical protein
MARCPRSVTSPRIAPTRIPEPAAAPSRRPILLP